MQGIYIHTQGSKNIKVRIGISSGRDWLRALNTSNEEGGKSICFVTCVTYTLW